MSETDSSERASKLPVSQFAFPGPLRDRLVGAILDGRKTTTTSLLAEYEIERAPLPREGERSVVVDSTGAPVCVIETEEVRVVALGDVDDQHVFDEGEGHATVSDWRDDHERYWRSCDVVESLGGSAPVLDDATPVVLERFRVITRLS